MNSPTSWGFCLHLVARDESFIWDLVDGPGYGDGGKLAEKFEEASCDSGCTRDFVSAF